MSHPQMYILHSRLKPGQESGYERAHAQIPADLFARLRGGGVRDWVIWRDRLELLHVVDVDDYDALGAELPTTPSTSDGRPR